MKILGVCTSSAAFMLLIIAARNSETELPAVIFWLVIFSLALPLFVHLATIGYQYILYSLSVANIDFWRTSKSNGAVYKAFIQQVRAIHKAKRSANAAVVDRLDAALNKIKF